MAAGPPALLSPKHLIIAHLVAAGRKDVEIAPIVGLTANRICVIKRSPLFLQQVRELQREMKEAAITNVADWLEEQTKPTLDRLVHLRDNADSEPVQATVSLALLDRISPKVTKLEERRDIHIHIDRRDAEEMRRALVEDDTGEPVLDAEIVPAARALPAGVSEQHHRGNMIRSVDEVLEELENRGG